MKIFYAMLGVTALSVSAVTAFSRRAAPIAVRRSIVAYATPAEFAKNEIASNDVSVLLMGNKRYFILQFECCKIHLSHGISFFFVHKYI